VELTKIHGYVCLLQGEESVDDPGSKLYKPTSKLLEKKAVAATSLKPKEEEKPERPVCIAFRHIYFPQYSSHCSRRVGVEIRFW